MTEVLKQNRSKWWRFSRYELKDGRIRPARGAQLEEYDPWVDYEKSRLMKSQPPYQSLLNLLDDRKNYKEKPTFKERRAPVGSRTEVFVGDEFSVDGMDAIVEWTKNYGLLGILTQQAVFISHRREWNGYEFMQRLSLRHGGSWITRFTDWIGPEDSFHFDFGDVEEPSFFRRRTTTTARDFFSKREIPEIFSVEFWHDYSEPITNWHSAAHDLSCAIQFQDERLLNAILSGAGQSIIFNDRSTGRPEVRVNYPSLLAAFAAMFAHDSVSGSRILKCAGCGSDLVTSAYQTRYCSRTCGDRDRKRKSRAAAAAKLAKVSRARARRHRTPA